MNVAFPETAEAVRIRFAIPMTDEELMQFCAENELARIERDSNGELIIMSPTGFDGAGVEGDVYGELWDWARQDGRGKACNSNAGVTLPDGSVRAADASWVSWERVNALTPKERKVFAPVCPEFVIEVRSESDKLPDIREKMQMWLRNGVALAWLVDPLRKAVEIYRPGRVMEEQVGQSSVYGDGPVAGFVLELGKVWG